MNITEKILANFGIILLGILGLFVLIGIIKSFRNRLAKNIFNVICIAGGAVSTVFLTGYGIKKIFEIETINKWIDDFVAKVEFLQGSSVEFAKGAVIAVVVAVVTPILFLICYFLVKLVLNIVLIFLPFIRKAMKRKVDGEKVEIGAGSRLLGVLLGIAGSVACFVVVVGPILSVADMVSYITAEIPDSLIESSSASSELEKQGIRLYSEGGETPSKNGTTNGLTEVIKYAGLAKKYTSPVGDSLVYKTFKNFKLTDAFEGYLNRVSMRKYTIDGKEYETQAYTDFKDLGRSAVIILSYYELEQQKSGSGLETISESKITEAVYGLFKNNAVIDAVDPILKNVLTSFCQGTLSLNDEETKAVLDTIKLKDFLDMTDGNKKAESENIGRFLVSVIEVLPALQNEGADMLDNVVTFGSVLDSMGGTNSFGKTPGKLLQAFIKSNETVKKYLSSEIINKLVSSVEEGKSSYTDYLINVKSGLNMAMTFAGKDLISGETTPTLTSEQIGEKLSEDFKAIYNSSNEAVKDVMIDVINGAVGEIENQEGVNEVKNTLVTDYFDNLYNYADKLKEAAGEDPEKQKEAEETFAKEAEAVGSVVGLVGKLSSGDELEVDTVSELADAIVGSQVLQDTISDLNSKDAEVRDQLKGKLDDSSNKSDIESMLDAKIAEAGDNEAAVNSLNDLKKALGLI